MDEQRRMLRKEKNEQGRGNIARSIIEEEHQWMNKRMKNEEETLQSTSLKGTFFNQYKNG